MHGTLATLAEQFDNVPVDYVRGGQRQCASVYPTFGQARRLDLIVRIEWECECERMWPARMNAMHEWQC